MTIATYAFKKGNTIITHKNIIGRIDMKKSLGTLWATAGLAVLIVSGCSKENNVVTDNGGGTPPANVTNETSARTSLALSDPFVQNDQLTIADQEALPTNYGTFGKVEVGITPLRWGRIVTSVAVTTKDTVWQGDSIAIVHVHKVIEGNFIIKAVNTAGDTVTLQKPFTDGADRNIVFLRVSRNPKRYWTNWVPVATSFVDGGTSAPNNLINIVKLQIFWPNGDTITVTDPLGYFLRYRWLHMFQGGRKDVPELMGGQQVTLQATVVSASPDTDLVALRYGVGGFQRRRTRMQMVSEVNNGNGTFTRVYQTPFFLHFHSGFFHAAVDAITRSTLYDDTAPYSSSWWGVPYRVF
jgi:hypothetical protein